MPSGNRGYDVESCDPETAGLRFIEVKGCREDAQAIAITRNEMLAALNGGDSFIFATVLVEDGFVYRPLYVPNPAPLFGADPGFNEVHRAISVASTGAAPKAGRRWRPPRALPILFGEMRHWQD